ncbi:Ribosomal protein S18 acetylase RimI [Filomicrobium insigne]|uniref:Ribosomal protein S18 acetylase RimI n=1 Tax=Filomicrobium insigne TaxID=418854 RepID=A0A1H0RK78_9HYPH|nr:GNAT family N-acetyltransferase [Filomicrobium insigne]SDP29338.1 Ribosomal protein S18 acetylase RimI [Filomicrobium insigne]
MTARYSDLPYEIGSVVARCGRQEAVRLEALSSDCADYFGAQFSAMTPWAEYGFSHQDLAKFLATSEVGAARILIRVAEAPAGVAVIRGQWLRGSYLHFLGILPAFQGRGVGAAVLSWWETHARGFGDRNLWITVSEFNTPARSFYGRQGFKEAAEIPGLIEEPHSEILLRKRLI